MTVVLLAAELLPLTGQPSVGAALLDNITFKIF